MSTLIEGRDVMGTVLSYSSVGSTGTFTAAANILSITPPAYSRDWIDLTNMNTTDYYEQGMSGGPIKSGSIAVAGVFVSATSWQNTTLLADFNAGTRCGWKLLVSGTSSYACVYGDGYITAYNPMTFPGMTGRIGFDMTIKITGKPTWSAAGTTT